MNKLPIEATLITREGFQKTIDLEDLKPYVYIPKMPKIDVAKMKSTQELQEVIIEEMTFVYKDHRTIRNFLSGDPVRIEAIYEEM